VDQLDGLLMELVRVGGLLQTPDHRLSMSQAFALHELDLADVLSQRDLAERLNLEKSTVSRLVAELERKELVVRERDPENRRFYRVRITPSGRSEHRRFAHEMHERYLAYLHGMSRSEQTALRTGLAGLVRSMHELADHGHTR
jgi:DNA-binding MarR family transcriptional regulator